jgi:hypothetical protein
MALAPPGKEGEVSSQLQLAEALATAIGAGAGGALLMVGSQLGLAPRLAAVPIFALTLLAALLGRLLSGRLATAKVAAGSG